MVTAPTCDHRTLSAGSTATVVSAFVRFWSLACDGGESDGLPDFRSQLHDVQPQRTPGRVTWCIPPTSYSCSAFYKLGTAGAAAGGATAARARPHAASGATLAGTM